jgi:hypothetical protein
MRNELPITCSLNATDLSARLAEIGALGRDALVDVQTEPACAVLRFASSAGVRERVVAIAEAESQCCGFLTLRVSDEPGTVVLTIDAPADAQIVLDELVDAFRARAQAD